MVCQIGLCWIEKNTQIVVMRILDKNEILVKCILLLGIFLSIAGYLLLGLDKQMVYVLLVVNVLVIYYTRNMQAAMLIFIFILTYNIHYLYNWQGVQLSPYVQFQKMEYYGIKIDTKELDTRDKDLTERISKIENEIYQLANTKFNISSPKQLAQVLFIDLAIPYPENSKKGYSTEVSILNKISMLHPIVNKVLEYRQLTKLYSTYVNGLRDSIYKDGKVHTIFEQALTETGRLSSIEPNLQNIPIRTEEGRLIRKLFIPSNEDYVLYSADYSQIELRVLASLANVEHFKLAFKNDEDIHSVTAKKIFGHDDVSSLERRKAKAVNFGIVYGISAYGLSNDIDISQKEAKEFIAKYYELNPEIKIYMENTIKECEENGFVKTIFNRRRYIPEIKSKNYLEREFGKRMAMNAPIQGSAADIIKKAMIDIDLAIKEQKINARMLVQVHDELVFEVREDEVTKLQNLVREKMINAVKLDVKLDVSDGIGKNWYELK